MPKDSYSGKNSSNSENEQKVSLKREIFEWIIVIEISIVLAVVINLFLLVNAIIPTGSMEPTIMVGDRIFGNRLAYVNSEPSRGDIVIFKYPDDESQLFIKRIIGEPGDVVWIRDGLVYINGSDTPLNEPYVKVIPTGNFGPYEVPEGYYFMMGDNRNNSADSRYWINPYVSEDKILGKAWVRYFPNPCVIDKENKQ